MLLALGAAFGCSDDPTQIVVVVDGDLAVPEDIDDVLVEASLPGADPQRSSGEVSTERPFPRTVALTHRGGALGPLRVRAVAVEDEVEVLDQTAVVSFARGRVLELPMFLSRLCRGTRCSEGNTCVQGVCRGTQRGPLDPWTGSPGGIDAGPALDGGIEPGGRVARGLVALYTFDEEGGAVISDSSGNDPPLDLTISDAAVTELGEGVLVVREPVVIRSPGPATRLISALLASNALTVEAWVSPSAAVMAGPARIVSLSQDPALRNFSLNHERERVEMRIRTSTSDMDGAPYLHSADATLGTALVHVVYAHGRDGVGRLFVDGEPSGRQMRTGDLSTWDASMPLLLANEATADRPWLGTLHLVAIYERALSADEVRQNFRAGADL